VIFVMNDFEPAGHSRVASARGEAGLRGSWAGSEDIMNWLRVLGNAETS
jgi:hypothetical protein